MNSQSTAAPVMMPVTPEYQRASSLVTARVPLRAVALVTSNEFRVASAAPVRAPVNSRVPQRASSCLLLRGALERVALVTSQDLERRFEEPVSAP
jgi:hypothetical protein